MKKQTAQVNNSAVNVEVKEGFQLVNGIEVPNDVVEQLAKYIKHSTRIRYLHTKNFTVSQIADILGKRYQHVRNVLITPVKKATGL